MNVESLKNYGRPYSETMTALPGVVQQRIRSEGAKVFRKHLGLLGLLRLFLLVDLLIKIGKIVVKVRILLV